MQEDYEKAVLVCEDTMEGIFSAVYDGWHWSVKGCPVEIRTEEPRGPELFCTVHHIPSDQEKSEKVLRSVRRKLGYAVYEAVCFAAVSAHPEKGTAVFRTLRSALGYGQCRRDILEDLADPWVNLLMKLRTRVWRELDHYYGFVRFRAVGREILLSRITPENDILLLLAPHFENRFPRENWVIFDGRRKKALFHPAKGKCTLRTGISVEELPASGHYPERADEYEDLWREFCKSITIRERSNPGLQQQMLPLRFRGDMPEFAEGGSR